MKRPAPSTGWVKRRKTAASTRSSSTTPMESHSTSPPTAGLVRRRIESLHAQLAADYFDDVAADPYVVAIFAQIYAPGALERRTLRSDVGRLGKTRADEPLRQAGIQAAGHGILVSAAANERAHLEGCVVPRLLRADYAELERRERRPVRLEREHLPGR